MSAPVLGGAATTDEPRRKAHRRMATKTTMRTKATSGPKAYENDPHEGTTPWSGLGGFGATRYAPDVRILVARCTVDYMGRLTAHLPEAPRVIMVKSDGSVLVHSDGGSYKPLNWMSPPCTLRMEKGADSSVVEVWTVENKAGEQLIVTLHEVLHEHEHELGVDPGLVKDGVEAHLQKLLAEHVESFGVGWRLVRREFPTAIGPVDLLCRDAEGRAVAVEIKRRGEIDGVEQLTRYLDLLNRDPLLSPVRGVFAAQEIKPQARVLAQDRGIECMVIDYDALRGRDDPEARLF